MVYIEKIKDSLLKCNCISLEPLLDAGLSKKLFMIEVRSKIRICDEQFWFTKIWNDNSNVNHRKVFCLILHLSMVPTISQIEVYIL
jgi:hypothetical protein